MEKTTDWLYLQLPLDEININKLSISNLAPITLPTMPILLFFPPDQTKTKVAVIIRIIFYQEFSQTNDHMPYVIWHL